MNDNRSITSNYVLIVKTLHGNPGDRITAVIHGVNEQTDPLILGKTYVMKCHEYEQLIRLILSVVHFQSHEKPFKDNQTDLFVLMSNTDVGKIVQIKFYAVNHAKSKEWKYQHVLLVHGTFLSYCNKTYSLFCCIQRYASLSK
jgi:hypothetical protein